MQLVSRVPLVHQGPLEHVVEMENQAFLVRLECQAELVIPVREVSLVRKVPLELMENLVHQAVWVPLGLMVLEVFKVK